MTDPAALVTGAARRIGRAIALALHEAGYAVAIHARNSVADAESLRDEIARAGGRAAVVRADLADHAAAAALVPAAAAAIGPLTLLVNNASSFEPDEIGALDAARFDRQFAVNLRAPLFLARSLRGAGAGRGRRSSTSSISACSSSRRTSSPTRWRRARCMRRRACWRRRSRPRCASTRSRPGRPCRACASSRRILPARRPRCRSAADRAPQEIAAAVVYLAGARSVTGVTLAVDGGQHLAWQTPDASVTE